MKVIIAGGRDYVFAPLDVEMLDRLHRILRFNEVISGGSGRRNKETGEVEAGADLFGEVFAARHQIPVMPFYITQQDWDEVGKFAGPRRNKSMADYARRHDGCCILFPGGKGTRSMRVEAWYAGIPFLAEDRGIWAWHCLKRDGLKLISLATNITITAMPGPVSRRIVMGGR